MLNLTKKIAIKSAGFGLSVTLIVLTAACSHQKIKNESVDLNPIPANEVLTSNESTAVPYPMDSMDNLTPAYGKSKQSVSRSVHSHKKHPRIAKHSRSRSALAMGRVKSKQKPHTKSAHTQPEPAVNVAMTPVAAPVVIPVPENLNPLNQLENTTSSARPPWLIWISGVSLMALVGLGLHLGRSKKSRRLVFNS